MKIFTRNKIDIQNIISWYSRQPQHKLCLVTNSSSTRQLLACEFLTSTFRFFFLIEGAWCATVRGRQSQITKCCGWRTKINFMWRLWCEESLSWGVKALNELQTNGNETFNGFSTSFFPLSAFSFCCNLQFFCRRKASKASETFLISVIFFSSFSFDFHPSSVEQPDALVGRRNLLKNCSVTQLRQCLPSSAGRQVYEAEEVLPVNVAAK